MRKTQPDYMVCYDCKRTAHKSEFLMFCGKSPNSEGQERIALCLMCVKRKAEAKGLDWKIRSRQLLAHAVKSGLIIPQLCMAADCGKVGTAHHHNYDTSYDIRIWLCLGHHMRFHHAKKNKKPCIRMIEKTFDIESDD